LYYRRELERKLPKRLKNLSRQAKLRSWKRYAVLLIQAVIYGTLDSLFFCVAGTFAYSLAEKIAFLKQLNID